MNILVAIPIPGLTKAIAAGLPGGHRVLDFDPAQSLPHCILRDQPELIVLDLTYPGYDTLSMLKDLKDAGVRFQVLALTPYSSDYLLRQLQQLQVGYVMMKPFGITNLIRRLYEMALLGTNQLSYLRAEAANFLLRLGFRRNLKGYELLLEAAILMLKDPKIPLVEGLYPQVAQVMGTTWQQVEKSIRDSIKDAWNSRDDALWQTYFPVGRDGQLRRVSASTILRVMVTRLSELC